MDKGKFIDQAQKYMLKGQIDKAIAEYQKAVEADPKDLRTRLKLGELYLKKENKVSAVDEYSKAAESFASDGFNLQAIAVYKQLLRIDASISDIYIRLADLYRKQGLIADALAQYRIVINNHEKQGKLGEAIDALKQMATMDPENFSIRAKIADLYLKSGNRKDALEEYSRIASDLKNKGRINDVIILYDKLLSADPSCTDALRELGEVYLRSGKRNEALSRLQDAIKGDPNDTKALSLLAETYIALNELGSSRLTYEHLLRVDPSSVEGGKGIVTLFIKEGDWKAAVEAAIPVVDKVIEKNGYDTALSILLEFYRNDIKDQQILEKMADVYRLKGERDKEIEVRDEIAHLYETRGEAAKAEEIEEEVEVEEVEEAHIEELPLEEHFVLRKEEAKEAPSEDISKYLTEAEVYVKYGLPDKAIDILKSAYDSFPDNVEVRNRLASLGVSIPGPVEEVLPELEEISLEVELPDGIEVPEIEEIAEVEVAEEAKPEEYPLSIVRKDLDEADFYIQQGLYDDARGVCNRILELYPGDEETLLKLNEIDEAVKAPASVPVSAPPAEEGAAESFFDLAAELDSEEFETLTTPPGMREGEKFGFEDLFSEFKKGVETQLEKEDTETHYNLGIAYKEMGLLDDAVREFKIAASDPKKEFDSYNLIGICYVEKGIPQKAVDIFKKGLELTGRAENEYASMNYELGEAYEQCGMIAEALSAYGESSRRSPGFRDVESKIARLGGTREVKKGRVSFI
ncbi:MAG: tetratricopeptide repeat protein [Deltaproteobacteria bacterium]|nr:tetratricopeptide repeat protein [Deltaproteobacteria bacterium]